MAPAFKILCYQEANIVTGKGKSPATNFRRISVVELLSTFKLF